MALLTVTALLLVSVLVPGLLFYTALGALLLAGTR